MAILRITRFSTDPAQEEEMLARRAKVVAATRRAHPGLRSTRLAKLDAETWVDVWEWESEDDFDAAVAWAHDNPDVPAAFALVRDVTAENGVVVG